MKSKSILFNDYPDVLEVKDVQAALGIGRHAVYDLINDRLLNAFKLKRAYKVTKTELIRYVQNLENNSDQ